MSVLFFLLLGIQDAQELIGRLNQGTEEAKALIRRQLILLPGAKEAIEDRLKHEMDIPLRDQLRLALTELDKEHDKQKLQKGLAEATAKSYRPLADRALSDDPKEVLRLLSDILPGYFSDPSREEFRIVVRAVLARPEAGGEWDTVRTRCVALLRRGPAEEESIQVVMAQLNSRSVELKIETLRAIQSLNATAAVPDVALQLTDSHDSLRLEALVTLRILRAKATGEAVAALLTDPSSAVRTEAAAALGQFGATTYARGVADLLADKVPAVQLAAMNALGQMKAKEFIPKIVERLDDPSRDVQLQAVRTLADLEATGHIDKISDLLKHEKLREACIETLGRLGNSQTATLIASHLTDADARVRIAGLSALARLAAKDQADAVAQRMSDTDPWVRREAINVLTQFRSTAHVKAIGDRLRDADPLVLMAVMRSLAELGAREFAAEVFQLTRPEAVSASLKDPAVNAAWNELIRAMAVETVGRLRPVALSEGIAALAKDPSHRVRKNAARALIRTSGTAHKKTLIDLLNDKERSVVFETIMAITELSAPRLSDEVSTRTFTLETLRDSAPRLLAAAQKALSLPIETRELILDPIEVTAPSPATLETLLHSVASERRYDLGVLMSDTRKAVILTRQEDAVRELTDWLNSIK